MVDHSVRYNSIEAHVSEGESQVTGIYKPCIRHPFFANKRDERLKSIADTFSPRRERNIDARPGPQPISATFSPGFRYFLKTPGKVLAEDLLSGLNPSHRESQRGGRHNDLLC